MATCPTCHTQYADSVDTCPTHGDALLPDSVFAQADSELAPGTIVGEYRIEGKLGEGAFGAVYRAVHPMIGKAAAIKVIGRSLSHDPQMVSRFVAEARAVNQIRHRNIIDVFGFGVVPDGRHYYAMELLEGMTFDAYLRAHGRLSLADALPILRGIARALDAAHAKGIFHRDLKPENVFLVLDDDGPPQPKLLDFGIAKLTQPGEATHKTKTGAAMGTPYYMSPEQCRGLDVDGRTDVYAFGVMAFEVLTGTLPFESASALDLLMMHLNEPVPRASVRLPELGTAFDDAFARAMAKDKEARPALATQALDEFARAGGIALSSSAGAGGAVLPVSDRAADVRPHGATELAHSQTIAHPATLITEPAATPSKTLGASSADVMAPPRRSPLVLAGVAVVAVLLGALGVVLVKGRATATADDRAPAAVAPPTAPQPAAPTASASAPSPAASAPAAPASTTVALTVEGATLDSVITVGGKKVGVGQGPHVVPRGQVALVLTVTAPGYKPFVGAFVPAEDGKVEAKLERAAGPAQKALQPAAPKPAPTPTLSKDLSQPDFGK